jgi:hypothetical protein
MVYVLKSNKKNLRHTTHLIKRYASQCDEPVKGVGVTKNARFEIMLFLQKPKRFQRG